MKKLIQAVIIIVTLFSNVFAQTAPFQVLIEPLNISGLGGLQAYAFGQHNGKWLIIGGRLDGLHRRQPFAAFDIAGHNNQLIVVDPIAQQKWTAPLSSLPTSMQEQLSSTNMEFHQQGDYLYLAGGYGYSATSADHITYPYLSAVKVSGVINAIIASTAITSYFRQITDTMFAVTGGSLKKINNTFYLTGGNKFMGRYNPMGPTSGPGYVQIYTNAVRKFKISDDGVTLTVSHLPSHIDATNLHRRDYNVVPQILSTGAEALTAFSGVFQASVDLPFLNSVTIDSTSFYVNPTFSQYYNHYHCAHIPIYSSSSNEMHSLFFGGIAQYYDSVGVLVQDNNVPFVKTIARVTRNASGVMSEYKLPIEMPSLLGAGSEFIPIKTLPHYNNEVFKFDDFTDDTTLVGYIYGGISSTGSNVFFVNTGVESVASSQIFKVYIIKNAVVGLHELNKQSVGTFQMQVYPNPNSGNFKVKFNLKEAITTTISILDSKGNLIEKTVLNNTYVGENTFSKFIDKIASVGTYFVTIETKYEKSTQKIVVEN